MVRNATNAKAANAPAKAPAESDTAPVPIPNTTTETAPVDAPADTPSTYGSASAFFSRLCNTAPQMASPAPQQAATSARLRRKSQMTLS